MARGPEHALAGAFMGGLVAARKAQSPLTSNPLAEVVGGTLGGWAFGRLPDRIEPALSPRHRGPAHAVAPVGAGSYWVGEKLDDMQEWCRQRAQGCAARAASAIDALVKVAWQLAESFWYFAAGFVAGALAGYVSHILLDCFTPGGLPLLGLTR